MSDKREGEIELGFDPATLSGDGRVVFIGRVCSPWKDRETCPKNMAAARETGEPATVEIHAPYRRGLAGLEAVSHVALLTWLDRAPRDLVVQKPRHAESPRGVFALRSPARPNPIGLHVARLTGVDVEAGLLRLEAIDVLDATPVVDVKPYYASTDSVPDAVTGKKR
ncbi:tRNA (N6-threonylcarbamoyladenosine(37)-N6)-methyltransferase TrmO [Aquamicrobium sp. LC103]|uniref:tRNA (N6-threonylcarbamoyladenosine(37)-N6)-methyltransferase TrmO n=1 Tax=Aquamicrobium sp. LC103 TaxID=1120658 RepID=UPI00063E90BA|nr:tRNA (N6-threonylcarbamoyladenosine(37)-N6)-methyltransferase TrmO [Aquamicrobium sp. LC103]TKT80167.1 tRNA (N6-threonylcarbamoyladenosine(37)-N6)-methyltransferase TrmO [Aquamicrobium sp. LC103]